MSQEVVAACMIMFYLHLAQVVYGWRIQNMILAAVLRRVI